MSALIAGIMAVANCTMVKTATKTIHWTMIIRIDIPNYHGTMRL